MFNRGSDKRKVFLNKDDYRRFLRGMYDFNDANPTLDSRLVSTEVRPREKLVEVFCYCLMPNHFHFMLRQLRNGGITLFMRKLGTGYSMYFNKKYERSGILFQGKFKSVHVEDNVYLRYLPHYIHLNPLGLSLPDWPIRELPKYTFNELARYPWSSLSEFLDISRRDSVADIAFLINIYPDGYQSALREWMLDVHQREEFLSHKLE